MLLCECLLIGKHVLHLPAVTAVHRTANPALVGVCHSAAILGISVAVIAPECEVGAIAGLELQTRQHVELCIERSHKLVFVIASCCRLVEGSYRVCQFLETRWWKREHTPVPCNGCRMLCQQRLAFLVREIHRLQRRECQCRAQHRAVLGVGSYRRTLSARVTDVHTHLQLIEEVTVVSLENSIVAVRAETPTVVVRLSIVAAHDTFLVEISQREEIVQTVIAAADAHLMLLNRGVIVEHLVLPVGALALERSDVLSRVTRGVAVVHLCLVHYNHILLSVQHRLLLPRVLPTVTEVIVNRCLACRSALRGYENNTVGSTRAVDGSRGSILQNLNRSDVNRVEITYATLHSHTVHDIERVGIVHRARTADSELRGGARLS